MRSVPAHRFDSSIPPHAVAIAHSARLNATFCVPDNGDPWWLTSSINGIAASVCAIRYADVPGSCTDANLISRPLLSRHIGPVRAGRSEGLHPVGITQIRTLSQRLRAATKSAVSFAHAWELIRGRCSAWSACDLVSLALRGVVARGGRCHVGYRRA